MERGLSVAQQGHTLHWWQRFLLLFYAAHFGGLLPFICWGALAMPGHPHAGPHFVFLPPPTYVVKPMNADDGMSDAGLLPSPSPAGVTHHTMEYVDSPHVVVHAMARCLRELATASAPAGQAHPTPLAVTMVLLTGALVALAFATHHRTGFVYHLASLLFAALDLRTPTPPPRTLPFL
ncbi:MAG: hypothetical protein KDE19_09010 [Caldilineaceae bacterium]|nr:hypothetical protein [Caldilineaceae bacterium]